MIHVLFQAAEMSWNQVQHTLFKQTRREVDQLIITSQVRSYLKQCRIKTTHCQGQNDLDVHQGREEVPA